jgi:hypothetical protein
MAFSDLPPIFSHWQAVPSAGNELSFEAAAAEPAARWSLDLPAGEDAVAYLEQAEAQLANAQAALDEAPQRLEAFMSQLQAGGGAQYALESTPAAEGELLHWMEVFQPGAVSFGDDEAQRWQALAQLEGYVNQVIGQVVHLAWVETRQEGALLATSQMSWKGDAQTAWEQEVTAEQRALHLRSLRLALASRLAMLKIIITSAQAAAKIGALMAAPGGALLALPAAWKYVQKLVALTQAETV